jgi:hypothetical protein
MAIENYPDIGVLVKIVMQSGAYFQGYWDGDRWYIGVDSNQFDAPLDQDLIAYWEYNTE